MSRQHRSSRAPLTKVGYGSEERIRRESEFLLRCYSDPNKHDAAGIGALCTTDGVFVTPAGIAYGRPEIENSYKKLFGQIAAEGFVTPVDQVQMLSGNTAIALGHWTLQSPGSQGYWTEVYELQDQEWNIRMHAHNITPPAPPPK